MTQVPANKPERPRPREPRDERVETGRLGRGPAVVALRRPHQPALGPGAPDLSLEHLQGLGRRLRALLTDRALVGSRSD